MKINVNESRVDIGIGEANSTAELIQVTRELSAESIGSFKSNTDIAGVLKKQLEAVENHDL